MLESQREVIADIDDKATRTVRMNALIEGIVVGPGQFDGTALFQPSFLYAGLWFFVSSPGTGLLTYSESNLYLGPNKA